MLCFLADELYIGTHASRQAVSPSKELYSNNSESLCCPQGILGDGELPCVDCTKHGATKLFLFTSSTVDA